MRPLFVFRPEPGASATAARAEALGLTAVAHPLFRVEPVPWTMPAAEFDGLLLTSANAVRCVGMLPALPVHAVGEATASAAREGGADLATVGSGGVDDLLLRLPGGLHLLHLAGEQRMPPRTAHVQVTAVPVYRTVALPPPPPESLEGAVLLVHSPAAGRRVADFPVTRTQVRVAAISEAAARACGTGWERLEAACKPLDGALLSLAAELCED